MTEKSATEKSAQEIAAFIVTTIDDKEKHVRSLATAQPPDAAETTDTAIAAASRLVKPYLETVRDAVRESGREASVEPKGPGPVSFTINATQIFTWVTCLQFAVARRVSEDCPNGVNECRVGLATTTGIYGNKLLLVCGHRVGFAEAGRGFDPLVEQHDRQWYVSEINKMIDKMLRMMSV